MRRRDLLAALSVLAGLPGAAQEVPKRRIGLLGSARPEAWTSRLVAFRAGLMEAGFVEGRNLTVEYRWAEGDNARLPGLAAELVTSNVEVIVVLGGTASALAAKAASGHIPVVFRIAGDPVEFGLVERLNEPGGTATGVTTIGAEIGPKQLELLHELVPASSIFAVLTNPTSPLSESASRQLAVPAKKLGLDLHIVAVSTDAEFDAAFAEARDLRAGALVITADTFFNSRNERTATLALKHRLAAISPYREFAEAGGLLAYGGSVAEASRQVGVYTGRILNGERPGALPVAQPVSFEFVLNLKTARALGITVPLSLQAQADEVIE